MNPVLLGNFLGLRLKTAQHPLSANRLLGNRDNAKFWHAFDASDGDHEIGLGGVGEDCWEQPNEEKRGCESLKAGRKSVAPATCHDDQFLVFDSHARIQGFSR